MRQESIVGTLVQQRDMYRVLLQQAQGSGGGAAGGAAKQPSAQEAQQQQQLGAVASPPGVARSALSQSFASAAEGPQQAVLNASQQSQQQQQQVLALEAMLESGRAELARVREEANVRIADLDAALNGEFLAPSPAALFAAMRTSTTHLAGVRGELLTARVSLATSSAEARFASDRVEALKGAEAAAREDAAREARRCGELQVGRHARRIYPFLC